MQALWHIDKKTSGVRLTELPGHPPNALHLESLYSLISSGTELTVARGQVPGSLHNSMRVPYMEGEFGFPVKYGYSLVGRISGTNTIGHVMHPHQSECIVSKEHFFELPADVPPKRATLAANLETALTGVWDGEVLQGDRVAIVGFGLIGSLIGRVISEIPATELCIYEVMRGRLELAQQFGFRASNNPIDAFGTYDVVFHCSGTQIGLQHAIELAGMEGRIIEMSWYGDRQVTISLGGSFHTMRKRIISSQVSHIPRRMQPEWNYLKRKQAVMELLRDPVYDDLITDEISLEQAAELFCQWRTQAPTGLAYCIKY